MRTEGLDADRLTRIVRDAGIGVPPTWYEEVGSTNTEALRLARGGAPTWALVAAGHQTDGKGRLGRRWIDRPGGALMFSIILRPPLRPDRAPLVGLLAAVEMIEAVGLVGLRAKWPNDLVVEDRKLAGILTEAQVDGDRVAHVVLGVGVNVDIAHEEFPEELRDRATSVSTEGGVDDHASILGRFLPQLHASLEDPSFPAGIVDRYSSVCSTLGRVVRATTSDGSAVEGTAIGIDDGGALELRVAGDRTTVAFGEIVHLR